MVLMESLALLEALFWVAGVVWSSLKQQVNLLLVEDTTADGLK